MSSRNERFTCELAKPEDRDPLLALYESTEFQGRISLQYTRRPDPLRSLAQEGDTVVFPVVRDTLTGEIAGGGCCVLRNAWVNGALRRVGYLTGLKVLPEYRRRIPGFAAFYRYLHQQCGEETALYYTTILEENHTARKLLEKPRRDMPRYCFQGNYTVYSFPAGRKAGATARLKIVEEEAWRAYCASHAPRFNLSMDRLPALGGGPRQRFLLLNGEGVPLGGCSVWNQQPFKQHIPIAYGGGYRLLQNVPLHWIGYPSLPPLGKPMNYGCITELYVTDDSPETAAALLRAVAAAVPEFSFLIVGFHQEHPLEKAMERIRHIRYRSRLYTVQWETGGLALDSRPIQLEVGLL